jgi:hypothetical protein
MLNLTFSAFEALMKKIIETDNSDCSALKFEY